MKAIIVDDEQHVREGIQLLANWEKYGITEVLEAENGEEAIKLIESKSPELIFTDIRMPVTDGIHLLKWVEQNRPDSVVIVISGFRDFDYISHTLRHGGTDYLLKPVERKTLDTVIQKAVSSINKIDSQRQALAKQSLQINRLNDLQINRLMVQLVLQPDQFTQNAMAVHHFPRIFSHYGYSVALLDLLFVTQDLLKHFNGDAIQMQHGIVEQINKLLGKDNNGLAFMHPRQNNEIVILVYLEMAEAVPLLENIAHQLRAYYSPGFPIPVAGVIQQAGPHAFEAALFSAQLALGQQNLSQPAPILQLAAKGNVDQIPLPKMPGEPLLYAVKSGDNNRIGDVIDAWMSLSSGAGHITRERLSIWYKDYLLTLRRLSHDNTPDDSGAKKLLNVEGQSLPILNVSGQLDKLLWKQFMIERFVRLTSRAMKYDESYPDPFEAVGAYIQEHLGDNISLSHVAKMFHYSESHFSRRFKERFGLSFTDYLRDHRIERSKSLLANPNLRIPEIAYMVGYPDEKYFSRVFSRCVQLPPQAYRKKILRRKNEEYQV